MPFCPRCGRAADPEDAYCTFCGAPIPDDVPVRPPTPPVPRAVPLNPSHPPPPRVDELTPAPAGGRMKVFGIIAVILVIAIAVFFAFSGHLLPAGTPSNASGSRDAGTGPILVIAGPGSGKTRVLTHRITYLIGTLGVRPYNILAVTFTNKAAKEMEARVASLLGYDPAEAAGRSFQGMPQLGTFHAICARLLRREAENLPFNANFVIYDADDQVALVKQAIADLNIDEKRYRAQGVHASISNAKNELLLPEAYPLQNYRDEVVKKVYQHYQERLLANNALDFDDLLLWTAFLLEQNPAVRDRYAKRFEHVLVDEFQDTNLVQYRLLNLLSATRQNLFVVGDEDQAIYRWRGADYRNVRRFQQDYPDAQTILLEQNYRSTQVILDAAMAVIDRHPGRTRMTRWRSQAPFCVCGPERQRVAIL